MSRQPAKPVATITVAIATRDRAASLARCLAAIAEGTVLPREVVVVDQSRDDRTRTVVEQQMDTLAIKYVHHDGSGLAVAQNLAFSYATCPIVAVTDDDCVPDPQWIAVIDKTFGTYDQLAMLTGRVLPLGDDVPGRYPVATRTSAVQVDFDGGALPWEIGSGNNFAVRRAWMVLIGGNDERLGPGAEGRGGADIDLFYRLSRAGASIRYEPRSLVKHERVNRAARLARRTPYGFGMGACCVLWLRQGDRGVIRVLGRWWLMRVWRLIHGLWHRDWLRGYEELLVLTGTIRGLWFGVRAGPQPRRIFPGNDV